MAVTLTLDFARQCLRCAHCGDAIEIPKSAMRNGEKFVAFGERARAKHNCRSAQEPRAERIRTLKPAAEAARREFDKLFHPAATCPAG